MGLVDLGARLRLVANEVDVVTPDAELPRLPVAHAVWVPRPDLATAAESWLTAGGPHHTCFTQALPFEAVEDLAEIAGIELVTIGSDTTASRFRRELRWNEAYHHLAGGLMPRPIPVSVRALHRLEPLHHVVRAAAEVVVQRAVLRDTARRRPRGVPGSGR